MTNEDIVMYIALGFSLSMVMYFIGQIGRVLIEAVEIFMSR